MARSLVKILKYGGLALVLLLLIVMFGSQTRIFKNWLAQQLEQLARRNLNAELNLGRISGNLISNIKIEDILLTTHGDTLFALDRLELQLRPKRLLKKQLIFRVVAIDSPRIHLVQASDENWNVSALMPPESTAPENQASFDWQIALDDIQIRGGSVRLQPYHPVPGLPDRITGIQARLGLHYQNDELQVRLADLQFNLIEPHLQIRQVRCRLRFANSRLDIPEWHLQTRESRFAGRAEVVFGRTPKIGMEFQATPLVTSEFQPFFPELKVDIRPEITGKLAMEADTLRWRATAALDTTRIDFGGLISLSDSIPAYYGQLAFQRFQIRSWVPEAPLTTWLNGTVDFSGRGLVPGSATLEVAAHLNRSRIARRSIDEMHIEATLRNTAVSSALRLRGPWGRLHLEAEASDLLKAPRIAAQTRFNNLDVREILFIDSMESSLNGGITFDGRWSKTGQVEGALTLNLAPSAFQNIGIDTVFCSAKLQNNNINIDRLQVSSPIGMVFLEGKMGLEAENDLRFYGELRDLRWARHQLGVDTLQARGDIRGRIYGPVDSLITRLDYRFHPVHYNDIVVDSLRGQFHGLLSGDALTGTNQTRLQSVRLAAATLDSVRLSLQLAATRGEARLMFWHRDSLQGGFHAQFRLDSVTTVILPEAWLDYRQQRWQAADGNMRIEFGDDFVKLDNIHLRSNHQLLRLDGIARLSGEEDLTLRIEQLDLATWLRLLRPDADIGGVLNGQIQIQGTADNPIMNGRLALENGWFIEFIYKRWLWDLRYRDGRLHWTFELQRDQDRSLTGQGYLPIRADFQNDGPWLQYDQPMRIQVATGGLDLSFLQAFTSQIRKIRGSFVCDINIENTLRDPHPMGYLRIVNGGFQIPKLGVDYRDFQLVLTVDSSKINIVQCDLAGGKGRLEVSGFAEYIRQGLQAQLKQAELQFNARQFQVTRHRNIEGVIDGAARLYGDLAEPRFEGAIRVLRSRVYLPAFEESEYLEEETPNFLLNMLKKQEQSEPSEPIIAGISSEAYLDHLRGSLKIEFPRNTWLRDPEMNVEIEGELDIVKSGPEFEHFGEIRVVRGTYDLYGRRFQIEKGVFNFEGGLEFNPKIEIEARHIFRDMQRQKRRLNLYITGFLFQPQLNFELDGYEIEERDAVAYLLFRRSFSDLTQGERTQLSQQNGLLNASTATNILAGLVASQLSRALGRQLNLDVIDLQGEDDWRRATIILGKYLTNDLFISYQRQLQLGQSEEVVPEQVILEYEITPFLLLQLTKGDRKSTGFDLIWKIEKR